MKPAPSTDVMEKLLMNHTSPPCAAPSLLPENVPVQFTPGDAQLSLIEYTPTIRSGEDPSNVNVMSTVKLAAKVVEVSVIPVTVTDPLMTSPGKSEQLLNWIVPDVPLPSTVTDPLSRQA